MTTLEEYRKDFKESAEAAPDDITSPRTRGSIIGALNKYCRGDYNRKQFLKALTGYASSKDLTNSEWHALRCFLDPEAEDVILSKCGEYAIDAVIAAAMPEQDRLL